jgi:hypothetical protein
LNSTFPMIPVLPRQSPLIAVASFLIWFSPEQYWITSIQSDSASSRLHPVWIASWIQVEHVQYIYTRQPQNYPGYLW